MKPPTPKEIGNEWFERVWKAREKSAMQVCGTAQFSHVRTCSLVPCLIFQFVFSDRSAMTPMHACTGRLSARIEAIFWELLRQIKKLPSVSFVTVRDGKITEGWDCWDYGALTATLSSPMV